MFFFKYVHQLQLKPRHIPKHPAWRLATWDFSRFSSSKDIFLWRHACVLNFDRTEHIYSMQFNIMQFINLNLSILNIYYGFKKWCNASDSHCHLSQGLQPLVWEHRNNDIWSVRAHLDGVKLHFVILMITHQNDTLFKRLLLQIRCNVFTFSFKSALSQSALCSFTVRSSTCLALVPPTYYPSSTHGCMRRCATCVLQGC